MNKLKEVKWLYNRWVNELGCKGLWYKLRLVNHCIRCCVHKSVWEPIDLINDLNEKRNNSPSQG